MRLDAIDGAAPSRPGDQQVVSALTLGAGALAVIAEGSIVTDGVLGEKLIFTQTTTPKSKFPRVRRSALWGDAAGVILFGRGKVSAFMGDLGAGLRDFKRTIRAAEEEEAPKER